MIKPIVKPIRFYPETHAYNRNGRTYFVNSRTGTWVVLSYSAVKQLNGNRNNEGFMKVYEALAEKFIIKDDRYQYVKTKSKVKPLLAKLQTTGMCNFRCVYCFNNEEIKTHSMTKKTLYQSIDYVFSNPYASNGILFAIYGGEPYADKERLYEALSYIREKSGSRSDVVTGIITNGSLLDDDDIAFIMDNDIHLSFSFDGLPEFQMNNRISRNKEEADLPLRNLKKIAAYRHTSVLATITREMSAHLEEIILYMEELGVTNIEFLPLRLLGKANGKNELSVNTSEYINALKNVVEAIECGKIKHLKVGTIMRLLLPLETGETVYGELGNRRCGAGKNSIHINYDGTIQGCDMLPDKYSPIIGDVWRGVDGLDKLESNIFDFGAASESCLVCPWSHFCRSGCVGASGSDEGSCNRKHTLSCATNKELYPFLLEKLVTDGGVLHNYFINHIS